MMKKSIIYAITLASLSLGVALPIHAQNKDDPITSTITDAKDKRVFKSVCKKKMPDWQRQKQELKIVDFIGKTQKVIVAQGGTKSKNAPPVSILLDEDYHAHPTTVMLDDNKTILAVWNLGHGGNAGPIAKSTDGGLTWERIDNVMPKAYQLFRNCPSIYKISDKNGKERIFVLARKTQDKKGLSVTQKSENYSGYMPRVMSEDNGKTWKLLPPLSSLDHKSPFACVMTFSSMIQLKDGSTLGIFHKGDGKGRDRQLKLVQSITHDGGLTWTEPQIILTPNDLGGLQPCEPFVFRSPDGNELCCIIRENSRKNGTSLVMFSKDEGKTWSKPIDTPWALTGDRHNGLYLPDGRLIFTFRDMTQPKENDKLYFGCWIGTYDDIKNGKAGQYRVLLSETKLRKDKRWKRDGYYQSMHLLPDNTIVAITYESIKDFTSSSITCHRFKIEDIEKLAK